MTEPISEQTDINILKALDDDGAKRCEAIQAEMDQLADRLAILSNEYVRWYTITLVNDAMRNLR